MDRKSLKKGFSQLKRSKSHNSLECELGPEKFEIFSEIIDIVARSPKEETPTRDEILRFVFEQTGRKISATTYSIYLKNRKNEIQEQETA